MITRPAGCALALFGLPIAVWGGALLADGSLIGGVVVAGLGLWIMFLGAKPHRAAKQRTLARLEEQGRAKKRCPACAEEILAEATKCRFCGEAQPPTVP